MKVIKDFKNDLLKRREVKIVMNAEKNPGFANALKMVAEHFKVGENVIAVKELKSKFGRDTFLVDASIYQNVKDKEMIEPKKKVKKKEGEAAASAPAAPAKK
jgi:ribosomal protein S24E